MVEICTEKKDNELFKKDAVRSDTEELAAERQVDAREPRTLEELRAAVRDRMVMDIVSGDQEEQQEEDSDNMDLENNQDNNDECKSYQESEIMNNFFKVINMKPTVAYKVKGSF